MLTKSRGISLLAVAFAIMFLLSARTARADSVSDVDHDGQWSADKDNGKSDEGDFDNKDWDEGIAKDNDGGDWDKDTKDSDGGDWEHDAKGNDPKSVPEPSSMVLLTIGIVGLTALARRQGNSRVRQLA